MSANQQIKFEEETGVADVRRVREAIAQRHAGDLQAHIVETKRVGAELREQLGLGPTVQPPQRDPSRGTGG